MKTLSKKSGLSGYLGTDDAREICTRIENNDDEAELIYKAMAYQISKEIGAYATVLEGKIDAIFITGGIAYDEKYLIKWIKDSCSFLGKIFVIPGEMAESAYLVLTGKEKVKSYSEIIKK